MRVSVKEKEGETISRCAVKCGSIEYRVVHSANADLLDVTTEGSEAKRRCLMPAGSNDAEGLMSEELMRGGPHRVYLRAMNCVRRLL